MSSNVFPALPGLGWSVHKTPTFSRTTIKSHSGRAVSSPDYAFPIWHFEVTFGGLSDSTVISPLGASSLQQLVGLYCAMVSTADTFLYSDPTDNLATDFFLGNGNGTQTDFQFYHYFGIFSEPVGQVAAGPIIKLNGVVQSSGYTIIAPNILRFSTPPGVVAVSATYNYYFVCSFSDDNVDFENIAHGFWQVQALKFESVKP